MKIPSKNSEKVFIRTIEEKDAGRRHLFWVQLSLAQQGIINTIDEIDYHVAESEMKIADFLHNKRGLWLINLNSSDEVVGEVDIITKPFLRTRHVGQLTIGVLPSYAGQGLASALMDQALSWAKTVGLKRLELFVFHSNKRARSLYQKFGFIEEGRRKNYLRREDDTYEDDHLMALYL